jgi:hypothetical protein
MSREARLALAVFAVGVVVMLTFDFTVARIAGVLLLLGGIATGAFAIATPDFTKDE